MTNSSDQTPQDDAVGIGDDQLPEDLQPGEDNPLAEPLEPGETAEVDLNEPSKSYAADHPESARNDGDGHERAANHPESARNDGATDETDASQ